jgi:hypothetical protein
VDGVKIPKVRPKDIIILIISDVNSAQKSDAYAIVLSPLKYCKIIILQILCKINKNLEWVKYIRNSLK